MFIPQLEFCKNSLFSFNLVLIHPRNIKMIQSSISSLTGVLEPIPGAPEGDTLDE